MRRWALAITFSVSLGEVRSQHDQPRIGKPFALSGARMYGVYRAKDRDDATEDLVVRGHFVAGDGVEVVHVERTSHATRHFAMWTREPFRLVLLAADGTELAEGALETETMTVYELPSDDQPVESGLWRTEKDTGGFHGRVPVVAGGVAVAIRREQTEVWRRTAPPFPPTVSAIACALGPETGCLTWTDHLALDDHYHASAIWRAGNREGWLSCLAHVGIPPYGTPWSLPRGSAEFSCQDLPGGTVTLHLTVF